MMTALKITADRIALSGESRCMMFRACNEGMEAMNSADVYKRQLQMLNMQINCWFGGVGVGWMNYFAFLIIAVFISGLMVGRTPEFLGKKVEAREMKIATLVVLMHPFLILVGTGISAAVALSLIHISRPARRE